MVRRDCKGDWIIETNCTETFQGFDENGFAAMLSKYWAILHFVPYQLCSPLSVSSSSHHMHTTCWRHKSEEELNIFKTCLFRMKFQLLHICAELVAWAFFFSLFFNQGQRCQKNKFILLQLLIKGPALISAKAGRVMATHCRAGGGLKSPIYSLLHLCNYQDHQQREKILIPRLCWPWSKYSHVYLRTGT